MTLPELLLVWPSWTPHDLWRWVLLVTGCAVMARGLFSKNIRIRDSSTFHGFLFGKITHRRWEVIWMRTLLIAIGVAMIGMALGLGSR